MYRGYPACHVKGNQRLIINIPSISPLIFCMLPLHAHHIPYVYIYIFHLNIIIYHHVWIPYYHLSCTDTHVIPYVYIYMYIYLHTCICIYIYYIYSPYNYHDVNIITSCSKDTHVNIPWYHLLFPVNSADSHDKKKKNIISHVFFKHDFSMDSHDHFC